MNLLEQLKSMTTVVADTGEIEQIKKYRPTDATTNPSLILKAAQLPEYQDLVNEAISYAKERGGNEAELIDHCSEKLCVNFGLEILKVVPGRVSTEVDANLSFDTSATIEKAKKYIDLYKENGIDKDRVLIKIATTWEGIKAAEQLEKEGIHCNLTLLFSFPQAVACAEAGVQLISPFVGRILDWYKKDEGVDGYPANKDPGVISVTEIFNYYKKFDYLTEVMGASFRNLGEITELAGSDLLTIAPALLKELQDTEGALPKKLDVEKAKSMNIEKTTYDEKKFRWDFNEDAMATEKLGEGIRKFYTDFVKLQSLIQEKIAS